MANSKVVIEVVSTAKGLKMTTKQVDDQTKSVDKLSGSQEKLGKRTDSTNKKEKALYQTNLSSAKGFSKMNQTIGGSSGSGALVGSYAILAANVFAVTAAFNTLRRAAGIEKLAEGLEAFSNTTGMSLDLVSKRLQETTGYAVSFEQAMKTAALSVSAGFGTAEMEGLTRVAKGASLALGRDMGDALDRLTRGAIKLEPEILDELGIMVRLDEATENYAATLNKSASQLTRFERQQAFMNAIISEGEAKFGDIANSIDPNAYDTLAAAFADLSKNTIYFLNLALIPTINFLVNNSGIFIGLVTMFASSILNRMLPALGDMATASRASAAAAVESMEIAASAGAGVSAAYVKQLRDLKGFPPSYKKIRGAIIQGTASTKEMAVAQGQLTRAMSKMLKDAGGDINKLTKTQRKYYDALEQTRDAVRNLKGEQEGTAAMKALNVARANLAQSEREIEIYAEMDRQTFTLAGTFKKWKNVIGLTRGALAAYKVELIAAQGLTKGAKTATDLLTLAYVNLQVVLRGVTISFKGLGKAIMAALPYLGLIIIAGQIVIGIFKWLGQKIFGLWTEEDEKAKEGWENLGTVLDGIPDKMEELRRVQERMGATSQGLIKQYKILGGLFKTVTEEAIRAERAVIAAGDLDDDKTANRWFRSAENVASGQSPIIAAAREMGKTDQGGALAQSVLGMSVDEYIIKGTEAGQTTREISEVMLTLLETGERTFNGLAQEVEGLARNFAEAEKEAQKFVRGMTQTTKYDTLSVSLKTIQNSIDSIIRESNEAGIPAFQALGGAIEKMGKSIQMLAGTEMMDMMKKANDIQAQISKKQMLLARTVDAERREAIEFEIKLLQSRYQHALNDASGLWIEINGQVQANIDFLIAGEKLTKKTVDDLKSRAKILKDIAKNEFTITAQKSIQDSINRANIQQLQRELTVKQGIFEDARRAMKEGKVLTEDQHAALVQEEEIKESIKTLEDEIADKRVVQAEATLAALKHEERRFAIIKETSQLQLSNARLVSKIEAFASGREEQQGKIATLQIQAAEKSFELAMQEQAIKIKIIAAEFELLNMKAAVERATVQRRQEQLRLEIEGHERAKKGFGGKTFEELRAMGPQRDARLTGEQLMLPTDPPPDVVKAGQKAVEAYWNRLYTMGRSPEQEIAYQELMRLYQGDAYDADIARASLQAFGDIDTALGLTTNSAAEILMLQADKTAQAILNAAYTAQDETNSVFKNVGNVFEQAGGGLNLANIVGTALGPSALSKARDTLKTKMDDMLGGQSEEDFRKNATEGDLATFESFQKAHAELVEKTKGKNFELANSFSQMGQIITSMFGEEGAVIAALSMGISTTLTSFDAIEESGLKSAEGIQAIGNMIGAVSAIMAADSQGKLREIDKQIAAEKKRDGKSKESLAKIKEMEKKKEQIARKAFEMNKKMLMAQTIANTAAGIMSTMKTGGFWVSPLAMVVAAMGAAQLAIISKQKFEGSSGSVSEPQRQALNIGKAANKIDVSRGAQGGEIGYLRGQRGMPGGAAGMRRYADGGPIIVGERGPEVIQPTTAGYNVIPNDQVGMGGNNVNFTINAVDATGVEQLLVEQRGNIIEMIRDAANNTGERFLEDVDTQAMGSTGGGYGG